jgi:O-antigen/teichoic acid export membrane protein
MSRSKRFFTGLLTSYAAIGVNILYTLASVPLALHYLDKEEFGLWALATQFSGYLMLLEFGMSGSVARSLSDHKDQKEDGVYGSILRTGSRVFAIQGFLVATAGFVLALFAPPLLDLPIRLHQPFTILMAAQAIMTGFKLSMGTLGAPLWCHQRLDLTNLINCINMATSFAVLWIGFHIGWHIYSLPISNFVGQLLCIMAIYYVCKRLDYYPSKIHRGNYSPQIFRDLFHFGGGLFIMNIGAQLASASQVIMISRLLGIETAAAWSIATKVFSMAQQFVARILDSSAGGLAEMVVRKEFTQLHKRFQELVSITALIAVTSSAGIALMNGSFIELWTSGKVTWEPWNNYLLGCVLFSTAISRCLTGLTGITKILGGMKYIFLFEGLVFVAVSILLAPLLGITGFLIAALACNSLITVNYAITYTARYFKIKKIFVIHWFINCIIILIALAGIFLILRSNIITHLSSLSQIFIQSIIFGLFILPGIYFWAIDLKIKKEINLYINMIISSLKKH